jgi:prophage DNA circulation protein
MKDIVNNNKESILLVIIIILVAWNIFTTNGVKTDVKSYKKQIELIQKDIDSSQVINKKIDTKVSEVKENVTVITKEVHNIDNTLTIVKNKTNEKVNTVGKLSNVELEFFFTNRYNQNIFTK